MLLRVGNLPDDLIVIGEVPNEVIAEALSVQTAAPGGVVS